MSQWLAPPLGSLEVGAGHVADGALTPAKIAGTAVITTDSRLSDARQLAAGADKTKLNGIAAGAEVNVNADWNAGSGDAQILNKPSLVQLHDRQHSVTAAADHTFPGGTTIFLRADGTFAVPAGGGAASMYFLDFTTEEVVFVG